MATLSRPWARSRRGAVVVAAGFVAASLAALALVGLWTDQAGAPQTGTSQPVAAAPGAGQDGPAPVQAPGSEVEHPPGSLEEVDIGAVVVDDPVELDQTAAVGSGLVLRVVDITPVTGEARGMGEVAGPALRVEVEATNPTSAPISLARVQIDLNHGPDRAPGMVLSGPDVQVFPDVLAPGEAAVSAVVFGVAPERRDMVQVLVSAVDDATTVVFEGPLR